MPLRHKDIGTRAQRKVPRESQTHGEREKGGGPVQIPSRETNLEGKERERRGGKFTPPGVGGVVRRFASVQHMQR